MTINKLNTMMDKGLQSFSGGVDLKLPLHIGDGFGTRCSGGTDEHRQKPLCSDYGLSPMEHLVNASHAIEHDGEIKVRTWHEEGFIKITITDTGCGIPGDIITSFVI